MFIITLYTICSKYFRGKNPTCKLQIAIKGWRFLSDQYDKLTSQQQFSHFKNQPTLGIHSLFIFWNTEHYIVQYCSVKLLLLTVFSLTFRWQLSHWCCISIERSWLSRPRRHSVTLQVHAVCLVVLTIITISYCFNLEDNRW